jgi:hypothetical protein
MAKWPERAIVEGDLFGYNELVWVNRRQQTEHEVRL